MNQTVVEFDPLLLDVSKLRMIYKDLRGLCLIGGRDHLRIPALSVQTKTSVYSGPELILLVDERIVVLRQRGEDGNRPLDRVVVVDDLGVPVYIHRDTANTVMHTHSPGQDTGTQIRHERSGMGTCIRKQRSATHLTDKLLVVLA